MTDNNPNTTESGYAPGTDPHEKEHAAAANHPDVRVKEAGAEGIRIVRVMPAPPQLVFDAWVNPEHFAQWFGEYGSSITVNEWDARPGGRWNTTMHAEYEGRPMDMPFFGTYLELDPPTHLALTFEDPEGSGNTELMTVDLVDLGDGTTEMTFTQTGGNLSADEYPRAMAGSLVFFLRMAELLERLQRS
jgi:uncharacterized protein YndB with AHSA1/START domain